MTFEFLINNTLSLNNYKPKIFSKNFNKKGKQYVERIEIS